MSSYITKLWNHRYAWIDNYFWSNKYWYVKLNDWDDWLNLDIKGRVVLTWDQFKQLINK